ncbi:MAG: hypothetical protein A2X94_08525 [Bdellovibrionales bacterium GWB1_55_8]|nr:MAG: hypothetical protein A2X94_08525 [Bdellovibrionales bacterium GWB1_55_8]
MRYKHLLQSKTFLLLIAFIVTLGALGTFLLNRPTKSAQPAHAEHTAEKPEYVCPMHPQIRQDRPGSCPICGMDLVKTNQANSGEADADTHAEHRMPEGHAPFKLSETRRQMIGVKFGHVERKPLFQQIDAAGRVAYDPELYTAQNEYREAIRQLERTRQSPIEEVKHSAERMVESAKLRLKILGLSDKQIAALGSDGDSGTNLLVPKPGENVWIYAEVFEMDLPFVKTGMEVTVTGGNLGAAKLSGKVAAVDRVLNPVTRTTKVRIQLANAAARLRPESFVNVTIHAPVGEQIAVPFDAILDTGKESWVFVLDETGLFQPRLVTIKFQAGDEVAIASGLEGGEAIVTSANFMIDSESRLKGVAAAAKEQGKAAPQCPPGEVWHDEMKHCMKAVEASGTDQ